VLVGGDLSTVAEHREQGDAGRGGQEAGHEQDSPDHDGGE
jgi:hypothetical protein